MPLAIKINSTRRYADALAARLTYRKLNAQLVVYFSKVKTHLVTSVLNSGSLT